MVDTRHAAVRQGDGGRESELRAFLARWADALAADPTYSPLLSLDAMPWTALADPPRDMAPRRDIPASPGPQLPRTSVEIEQLLQRIEARYAAEVWALRDELRRIAVDHHMAHCRGLGL